MDNEGDNVFFILSVFLGVLLSLVLINCHDLDVRGRLRQDCYPNKTCNEKLECRSGVCVEVQNAK